MSQYTDPDLNPAPTFSETVRDVIRFLRRPSLPVVAEEEEEFAPTPVQNPGRLFMHLLGLSLLLGLSMVMLLGVLQRAGLMPELPHAMEDAMKSIPFALLFLLVAVVMPALEELAFRLWLVYTPQYFLISLWLVAIFMHSTLMQVGGAYLGYGILGVATLITIWLLAFKETAQRSMHKLYIHHYGWIFYGATALFALLHLINFKPDPQILLFAPLLVLPQLLLGLVLGYLRVKLSMIWAIALHGMYNALILTLAYTGMQADTAAPTACLLIF